MSDPEPMEDYEREHQHDPSLCVVDSLRGFARYRAHRGARIHMTPADRARIEAEVRERQAAADETINV